jgi:hypothetical protein
MKPGAALWGVLLAASACSDPSVANRQKIKDAGGDAIADAENGHPGCRIATPTTLDAGCGDVPESILRESCVGSICHHPPPGSAMGLDLLSPCVADRLVGRVSSCHGRLLIDPTRPEESFIVEKLTQDAPECGGKSMPYEDHLSSGALACVLSWVTAVASEAATSAK